MSVRAFATHVQMFIVAGRVDQPYLYMSSVSCQDFVRRRVGGSNPVFHRFAVHVRMANSTAWIVHSGRRRNPRLRLFCFSHAGGGASTFRGWSAKLPETVEVCPVQLPGRENRFTEPRHDRLEDLIPELCDGLSSLLDIPFAFFGYSMGTLVGFELARELRRRNMAQPTHLVLAARRAPRIPARTPPIAHLPNPKFVQELARLDGIPTEIVQDVDVLEFFLPLLRADITLCERYQYRSEAPLDSGFTLYGGIEDPDVARFDLEAWAVESAQACTVRMFDGGHFFLRQRSDQVLSSLRHDISRILERLV